MPESHHTLSPIHRALRMAVLVLAMTGGLNTAYAARCADYTTCRQAVVNWCAGNHARADGDSDGIPCENVCDTRSQVMAIMEEIGCSR